MCVTTSGNYVSSPLLLLANQTPICMVTPPVCSAQGSTSGHIRAGSWGSCGETQPLPDLSNSPCCSGTWVMELEGNVLKAWFGLPLNPPQQTAQSGFCMQISACIFLPHAEATQACYQMWALMLPSNVVTTTCWSVQALTTSPAAKKPSRSVLITNKEVSKNPSCN